ncbi:LLM class F420-dependent oxidoreductase [Rhodococcus sp. IEGM1428]|uniref:LLM class F420-dependent oxidoreductase n=1 Tax=Rhodococcus sp. IEGM1428 TaxID=3392191 RepID=UPI003D143C61
MKFGISTFLTDESIGPADIAKALQERQFDSLFLAEHTHIPVGWLPEGSAFELPRHYHRTLDPFVALAAAATATDQLLLGTGIALVVQRDPITTAKAVATLDHVSGGRVILGVGAGWLEAEMRNHGTDPRTRGALMDERIEAMIALWTQEQAEYHGKFVDFDPVYSWPKPIQQPHPPIYVGGVSKRAHIRVSKYAQAWMPNEVPPDQLGEQIDRMRQVTGNRTPVTVFGAPHDPESLEKLSQLDIDRVLLMLDTQSRDDALRSLDALRSATEKFNS